MWRPMVAFCALLVALGAANPTNVLTGRAAFVTASGITPGTFRKITVADLPKPFMTESATLRSRIAPRPAGAMPQAPAGFHVGLFADGLSMPRVIRVAPNGDIFLAETQAGQVRVFRGMSADGSRGRLRYSQPVFMSLTAWFSIRREKIRSGCT